MKNSICIIGLNKQFTKHLAYAFACSCDLYYVDVDEMIKFELIDIVEAEQLCGVEYIDKITANKVKNISTYEYTVFTIDMSTLNIGNNADTVKKNALTVFLDLPKKLAIESDDDSKKTINISVFNEKRKYFKSMCDVVVPLTTKSTVSGVEKISKQIAEFYNRGKNE